MTLLLYANFTVRTPSADPVGSRTQLAAGIRRGLLISATILVGVTPLSSGSGLFGTFAPATIEHPASNQLQSTSARFADFGKQTASPDARHVADWVADSGDAGGFDFLIVDKKNATVHVFDGEPCTALNPAAV